jgi:hypothetical protein
MNIATMFTTSMLMRLRWRRKNPIGIGIGMSR